MGDHADKLEAISERICGPMLDTFDGLLIEELSECPQEELLDVLHAACACATAVINTTIARITLDDKREVVATYALSRVRLMMGLGEPQ